MARKDFYVGLKDIANGQGFLSSESEMSAVSLRGDPPLYWFC